MNSNISQALWIIVANPKLYSSSAYTFFQTLFQILNIRFPPFKKNNVRQWLSESIQQPFWNEATAKWESPKLWGPYLWTMMIAIAKQPELTTNLFIRFLRDLVYVLPCKVCSKHFKHLLNHTNLNVEDKVSLVGLLRERVRKNNNNESSYVKPKSTRNLNQLHVQRVKPLGCGC